LVPIAYRSFFLMMNNRGLLGDDLPRGGARVAWNSLMLVAAGAATVASVWVIWSKSGWMGISAIAGFLLLAVVVHFARRSSTSV
ncbi:MAG: hypothetical protein CMJ85_08345, partial [Planctomycetes bacterium]|nr:hypothetical protein [Planctomycetota bacterium]